MGKKNTSLLNSVYVPMIGCFVAGVVVSRLMNNQDVVTGDLKEGATKNSITVWSLAIIGALMVVMVIVTKRKVKSILDAVEAAAATGSGS